MIPMATQTEVMAKTYKPGNTVEGSGVYRVTHDAAHLKPHDVTVVQGKPFPPCRGCKQPRFKAVLLARHIDNHKEFKRTYTVGVS